MKKAILSLLITSISSFAYGEPIYLSCKVIDDEGAARTYTVSLDKDTRKITHTSTMEGGRAHNVEGFFSPETISYKYSVSITGWMMQTNTYSINRADLSVVNERRLEIFKTNQSHVDIRTGTCEIIKVKGKI